LRKGFFFCHNLSLGEKYVFVKASGKVKFILRKMALLLRKVRKKGQFSEYYKGEI